MCDSSLPFGPTLSIQSCLHRSCRLELQPLGGCDLDSFTCLPEWPIGHADAVVCINMLHIAPWPAAEGLMAGAGRALTPGGVLYLYGPFRKDGRHTASSNAAFDASLRARNPAWGIRDVGRLQNWRADMGWISSINFRCLRTISASSSGVPRVEPHR